MFNLLKTRWKVEYFSYSKAIFCVMP